MATNRKRHYCVIDHANKQGDRDRVNPNLASQRRARYRRTEASVNSSGGAAYASDLTEDFG